jgi:hypothetical protein
MEIEWPTVVEGGIPILGGLYATALGYGAIRLQMRPGSPAQNLLPRLKWLGPFVMVFGVFTAWQTHVHVVHPPAEELAQQIASRSTLPLRVDSMTTLNSVQGRENTIVYSYSIAAPLPDLGGRSVVQAKLEQQWRGLACTNHDVQKMLSTGYALQIEYTFPATSSPIVIPVVPLASCKS